MTNRRKYILAVAAVATAAGFGYIKSSHRNIPSDLRDAVADKGFDTGIPSFEKDAGNIPEPKAAAVKGINKDYVEPVEPATPIEYVAIPGVDEPKAARTAPTVKVVSDFTRKTLFRVFEDAKPIVHKRLFAAGLLPVRNGSHQCRLSQAFFDIQRDITDRGSPTVACDVSVKLSCQTTARQWVACFVGHGRTTGHSEWGAYSQAVDNALSGLSAAFSPAGSCSAWRASPAPQER